MPVPCVAGYYPCLDESSRFLARRLPVFATVLTASHGARPARGPAGVTVGVRPDSGARFASGFNQWDSTEMAATKMI